MAAFPTYVRMLFAGYGESFDPAIERVEMERGAPKQSARNSQVLMKLSASLVFQSAADAVSFEAWYFDTLHRIDFFTMTHPRTGASITARFENGSIGTLAPMGPVFSSSSRDVVIEYLR